MKIFEIAILIGLCVMILLGSFFTAAMFSATSIEGLNNGTYQKNLSEQFGTSVDAASNVTARGITAFEIVNAWVYVFAAMMIIAILILAFKLFY